MPDGTEALDVFALFVLIVLLITGVVGGLWLAALPGAMARKRQHPQALAVAVCGWMGLLTGGVCWVIAIVWACLDRPAGKAVGGVSPAKQGAAA